MNMDAGGDDIGQAVQVRRFELVAARKQQRGRLREHFQFNADIIAETDLSADAEGKPLRHYLTDVYPPFSGKAEAV